MHIKFLLGCLSLLLPVALLAAPGWPELPTDATIASTARAYAEKYSARVASPTMPGSPPDGSYSQTSYQIARVLTFHNPKIGNPIASGEAFVLLQRVTDDVRPGGSRRSVSFALVRLDHEPGPGFKLDHVGGWDKAPTDSELGGFIGGYLNGYYGRTLFEGYSRDDIWLPGFAQGKRQIVVAAFDGASDKAHMPFTFHVSVTDAGRPAAGADIAVRFTGDIKALGEQFATWGEAQGQWQLVSGINFALNQPFPVKLDAQGKAIVRGYLDFGRMKLNGLKLPVSAGIEVTAAGAPPVQSAVRLAFPAFIRNVYFWCANDPRWPGASRWIRLSYLAGRDNESFIEQVEDQRTGPVVKPRNRYGVGDRPVYPTPWEIPKRLLLNRKPYELPSWETDFYDPLKEDDELVLDLAQRGKMASGGFSPMPGDGLMVEVLWMDGVTALFSLRRDAEDLFVLRLAGSGQTQSGTAEQTWVRFFAGQAADWLVTDRLIQAAAVGGATLVGGPVAGAWAAVVTEAGLKVKDAAELFKAGSTHHKVVLIRSTVALTHRPDGGFRLHTFSGNPGVLDRGREVRARPGEALDFTLANGPTGPVRAQPLAAAVAMQAALPQRESAAAARGQAPRAVAIPTSVAPAAATAAPPLRPPAPASAAPRATTLGKPAQDELAAAQREYDQAFKEYTQLVTTGGSGSVEAALARYRAAYTRLQALKSQRQ